MRYALYCGIHAGMGYGEVVMSRPEWFDLDARVVQITASAEWEPKDRENRAVPLTAEFLEFLEGFMHPGPFMIAPHKLAAVKHRYRFDFSPRFENYVRRQGLRCTFHDLRPTFASLRVSAGVSPYKVAKWLGNSIAMIEKHYGHLIPSDDKINGGAERLNGSSPAPPICGESPHLALSCEELHVLVWSKPLLHAARELGIRTSA